MNKVLIGSMAVTAIAIGGMIALLQTTTDAANMPAQNNVTQSDNKQQIAITAKGGYFPRVTNAKANTPTIINLSTNGSYDCSTAFTIPSLGIRENLPATGVTSIEIPPQKPGATIKGLCSMGMYYFTIAFK